MAWNHLARYGLRMNRLARLALPFLVAFAAASVGCSPPSSAPPQEPISGCKVTDGDTVRCGDERVRLLGIDTAEMPGHCRRGRNCVEGDPHAAKRSLERLIAGRELTIHRAGKDRYQRTLATMRADGEDLSCHQLAEDHAIYRDDWDDDGLIADTCPDLAVAG